MASEVPGALHFGSWAFMCRGLKPRQCGLVQERMVEAGPEPIRSLQHLLGGASRRRRSTAWSGTGGAGRSARACATGVARCGTGRCTTRCGAAARWGGRAAGCTAGCARTAAGGACSARRACRARAAGAGAAGGRSCAAGAGARAARRAARGSRSIGAAGCRRSILLAAST
jgi:hypothetical protein